MHAVNAMTTLWGVLRAVALALSICGSAPARAETSNGNDFALRLSEARGEAARQKLFEEAKDRPHFFRYLQIMETREIDGGGDRGIRITAFEPASCMDVAFTVTKPVSISILREEPVSKVGDAIAVTGKVVAVDRARNAILLESPIVRHKDRLSPKMGKELLGEVAPGAVYYSYTAGKRPVKLGYEDRDLLQHRDQILAERGPDGWVEFLEHEVALRKQQRAGAGKQGGDAR
jgi:hypothetical protein